MDDNFDDVFDDKSNENSATTNDDATVFETETTTEETTEATDNTTTEEGGETEAKDQPRDDKGQYASKKNWVPVEALIAERQKREAEAQQRAEYEAKLREYEAAQRQTTRPDPFENPDDYDRYVQEQVDLRLEQRLHQMQQQQHEQMLAQQSEAMFESFAATMGNHSQEAITEALEYAAAYATNDDAWGHEVLRSPDPIARILEEKNRHAQQQQDWLDYSRDPQGFIARKAAEMSVAGTPNNSFAAPATATNTAATAHAPRSLASLGGGTASNPTAQSASEAFDAIFDSKR